MTAPDAPTSSRRCLFCGSSGPLNREHIWPDWMNREFPSLQGMSKHFTDLDDPGRREWTEGTFAQRSRIVCVACNGGWMSRCEQLRDSLATAESRAFSAETARLINRHVEDCADCERRLAAAVAPEALFSAVPILVAPPHVRESIATGLRSAGLDLDRADAPSPQAHAFRSWRGVALASAVALVLLLAIAAVAERSRNSDQPAVVGAIGAPEGSPTAGSTTPSASVSGSTPATAPTTTTVTAPAAPPSSTSPSVAPPVPTSQPPTTQPPTTQPPPPAPPTVDSFTATPASTPGGACAPGSWATTLVWTTTGATGVSVQATTVVPITDLPPDGSRVACRPTPGAPPGGWTLTAIGPGGNVTATS